MLTEIKDMTQCRDDNRKEKKMEEENMKNSIATLFKVGPKVTDCGLNDQDSTLLICTHSLITVPGRDVSTVHQASVLTL